MGEYVAYPEYKDSGVEWIQKMPKDWRIKRLKFSVELINQKIDAESSDLSYMGLEHIEPWTGKRIEDETASSEGIATRFLPDDVLFGKLRPYLAKVHLAKHEGLVSTEALVLRKSSDLDSGFLRYYLVSKDFINTVDSSTYGSKMPRASWDFIGNLPLLIPEHKEQQTIARFLDYKTAQIDALIAKKEALLKKLAEKRTALISHAVTKGLDPSATMKDSGVPWLGKIPAHWEAIRLKFISKNILTGTTPPSAESSYYDEGELDWFTPADFSIDSLMLSNAKKKIHETALIDKKVKLIPAGSILIIGIGATLGKVGLVRLEATSNQQINAVIPSDSVVPEFLLYSLFVKQDMMRVISNATTLGIMNQEKTKQILLALPPLGEQQSIISKIQDSETRYAKSTTKISAVIEKLKEYRTALITQAVTGKIDLRQVPVPAQPEAEAA